MTKTIEGRLFICQAVTDLSLSAVNMTLRSSSREPNTRRSSRRLRQENRHSKSTCSRCESEGRHSSITLVWGSTKSKLTPSWWQNHQSFQALISKYNKLNIVRRASFTSSVFSTLGLGQKTNCSGSTLCDVTKITYTSLAVTDN